MPATADISVIYRDDRLIAVAKPSGMVIHRGWATDKSTVYDIVRDEIVGQQVYAVHRLDRGTSGVLVFALNAETARDLQEVILAGGMAKRYLALVRGPMTDRRILNHPVRQPDVDRRLPATTEFDPIASSGRWTLVEARPITGRSHQIRSHLKHISHPIVGDVRYGKGDVNRLFRAQYRFHRMALHAWRLRLDQKGGSTLDLHAPLPSDFADLLRQLDLPVPD